MYLVRHFTNTLSVYWLLADPVQPTMCWPCGLVLHAGWLSAHATYISSDVALDPGFAGLSMPEHSGRCTVTAAPSHRERPNAEQPERVETCHEHRHEQQVHRGPHAQDLPLQRLNRDVAQRLRDPDKQHRQGAVEDQQQRRTLEPEG